MRGKKSSTKSTKIIPKIVSIFNPPQRHFLNQKFFENILTIRMYLIYLKGNKRKIVDDAYHGKVHWKRSDC